MSDTKAETPMVVCDWSEVAAQNPHGQDTHCVNPRPAPPLVGGAICPCCEMGQHEKCGNDESVGAICYCQQGACAVPQTAQGVADAPAKSCEVYAAYHAEKASYGGVGFEFHARAETFLRDQDAELARLRAERDGLISQAEKHVKEVHKWDAQQSSLEKQLAAARAEGDALRADGGRTRAQLSEKEAALKAALIEAMQLRESMGVDEVGFASMLVAKDRWQHRAIAAEKALAEKEAELVALRDERDRMKANWLGRLKAEDNRVERLIRERNAQLAAKDAEIARLKQQVEHFTERANHWGAEFLDANNAKCALREQLARDNAEIAALRKEREGFDSPIEVDGYPIASAASWRRAYNGAQNIADELRKRLTESRAAQAKAEQELVSLREELARVRAETEERTVLDV